MSAKEIHLDDSARRALCDTLEHFQKVHKPDSGEYRYSEPIASD
jgi:hypothetical protein